VSGSLLSSHQLRESSAVLRLGHSLFPLFALALDLPEDFFDDKVSPARGDCDAD
jgi:isopenicillin N synthase-like dioxygenase